MKKLLIILLTVAAITACTPAYNQFHSMQKAFLAGCVYSTISSSVTEDGGVLVLKATCNRAK